MTKPNTAFSVAAFLLVCCFGFLNIFAQTPTNKLQAQPSYEVVLQTLIASNADSGKADVPQTLAAAVRKLKTNYPYSNYRLSSTFLQRVADTGNVELKSVSSEMNINQEKNFPVFSDWTLTDLRFLPDANGQKSFQFQAFRFGQKIPIVTGWVKDDSGKGNPIVNYENVGLTIQRFSLAENVPTVIGSLSTTKPDELMFLVLTVKSAD